MTFVYPWFLWALAAVAIPILIHLFNFRKYKKVYFSNVKFLKELQLESKSRSRLKEILVLACRCLALACLALAFAQPVLPGEEGKKVQGATNDISIYIDNSFSMDNVTRQGPLLQVAKTQARELVNAFGNADKFQIITNDFEGRHQRFHTKEDAVNIIENLQTSPTQRALTEVIKRQRDFLSGGSGTSKRIFAISDAQRSTFNIEDLQNDTSSRLSLVPLKANQVNNIAVDSCWFDSPLQQKGFIQKLHARIINHGSNVVEVGSAKLQLNGQQVALASFSLEAMGSAQVQFVFENKRSGFNFGSITIEDYPVTFDDELYFAFNSELNVRVSLINGRELPAQNAFSSLFESDSLYSLKVFAEQGIDFGAFQNSDVIVLNQVQTIGSGLLAELKKFFLQGGVLIFVPHENPDSQSYSEAMNGFGLPAFASLDTSTLRTDKIEYASAFYSGVFEKIDQRINLPLVNRHFALGSRVGDYENILSLQNGDVFLGMGKKDNAKIYFFTSALNERSGNFSKHALFVPSIYRMAFSSLKLFPLSYAAGSNVVIPLKKEPEQAEAPPHIVQKDGKTDIIPEIRNGAGGSLIYTRGQVTQPGFYEIKRNEKSLLPLAFNFPRTESDLRCYIAAEIEELIESKNLKYVNVLNGVDEDLAKQVMMESGGKRLWKLFIFLTLLFLALEVILLRLLK